MENISFTKQEKDIIIKQIQQYMLEELDIEIGLFDSEFLLDFFSEKVGGYFYNRGLYDAHAVIEIQLDKIDEALYEIEKPTEFSK